MPRIEAATVAEHNAMRRRQVVDAAAEVLGEVGVNGFTPAAVAKRPSTEALLGAAISEMLVRSRDRMSEAIDGAGTPAERVTAYVREAIADATSGHATMPDVHAIEMPEVCREGVRALHDEIMEPLRSALEDAGVPDPGMASVLVRGLVNAAVSAARRGAPRAALEDATVEFVLAGVGLGAPAALV